MRLTVMRHLPAILLIAAAVSSGCLARPVLKPGEVPEPQPLTSEDRVRALSAVNAFSNDSGCPLSADVRGQARLSAVSSKILHAAGYDPAAVPVKLLMSPGDANAMLINGNAIIVFDGLLNKLTGDAELAAVVSHEVAHLLGGHLKESTESEREQKLSFGSTLLGVAANVGLSAAGYGGFGQLAGDTIKGTANTIGYGAYVRAYDRSQEYEADQIGLVLMSKAGYDPHAAISLWKRARQIFGDPPPGHMSFFSTHPDAEDRAERLEKILPIALKAAGPGSSADKQQER